LKHSYVSLATILEPTAACMVISNICLHQEANKNNNINHNKGKYFNAEYCKEHTKANI
jgi:hypothetical protein